uniref:Uncharacterized protein n=1 Tax=Mola mola TaxID=94237 RepID=A0A3Q4B5Y2_MOLML
MWLLSLTTCSTLASGQNHNSNIAKEMPTTQETTTSSLPSDVYQSNIINTSPTVEETTRASTKTVQTTPMIVSPNIPTPATPTYSTSSQLDSSTVSATGAHLKLTSSAATVVTSPARDRATAAPSVPTRSTLSQDTGKTSQSTSVESTYSSTQPTRSTNFISTSTISTKPTENKFTSTSPVIQRSSGLYKTSTVIHVTRPKKKQALPKLNSKTESNHGKIVAGIIVGALALMLVAFLVIYIKKRKLQKQQIATEDWAGPSPFLENEADNGHVILKSSNRISLSTFLPQRLSKRLYLVPKGDEEWEDITPRTTFGDKYQEDTLDQEVARNDVPERNGTAVAASEANKGDAPETAEISTMMSVCTLPSGTLPLTPRAGILNVTAGETLCCLGW